MKWETEAFRLLSKLVSIPSVNPGKQEYYTEPYGELEVAEKLITYLKGNMPYMEVGKEEVLPNRYNVYANYYRGVKYPTLLLVTHLDTVGVQGMTIDPFTLVDNHGKWFGRGANDDKGQITAMLIGLQKALHEEEGKVPLNINFVAVIDEEHLHRGVDYLVENDEIHADLAIVGEPTELEVAAFHKGSIRFKVTTHGKSAHSSTPDEGENAIDQMSDTIQVLKGTVKKEVENITHQFCGKSTISQTLINGGEQVNIIPDECTIHVDRRLNPQENWKESFTHIKETVQKEMSDEMWEHITWHHPYLIDPPLFNNLENESLVTLKYIMRELNKEFNYTGLQFGCDASKIAPKGIPTVVFGPGSIKQAHTKDEWLDSKDLMRAVDIYVYIFRNFSLER